MDLPKSPGRVLILLLFGMTIAAFYAFRSASMDWGVFITGVATADLVAHAGAQEITVLPDSTITATTAGNDIAAMYFNAQRPGYAQLTLVFCGRHQDRPRSDGRESRSIHSSLAGFAKVFQRIRLPNTISNSLEFVVPAQWNLHAFYFGVYFL